jgi:predicted transcriptional regulator
MPLDSLERLKPWMNPPFVQDAVLAFVRASTGPVFMREICDALDLSATAVNLVLYRLHTRGVVSRYKIPAQQVGGWSKKLKRPLPGGVTRATYLYSYVPEDGE